MCLCVSSSLCRALSVQRNHQGWYHHPHSSLTCFLVRTLIRKSSDVFIVARDYHHMRMLASSHLVCIPSISTFCLSLSPSLPPSLPLPPSLSPSLPLFLFLPPCLPLLGEITIAQASKAQQILHFTTKLGYPFFTVNGTLLCTNFRVCFVPDPSSPKKKANAHVSRSHHVPVHVIL